MIIDVRSTLETLFRSYCMVSTIDEEANFFDLGIQSIELTQIATKLSELLNQNISILLFYEYPNLVLLSRYIESCIQ